MGRCDGFCRGEPDAAGVSGDASMQARALLCGSLQDARTRAARTEMEHAAEQLDFEQAAVLRDRIARHRGARQDASRSSPASAPTPTSGACYTGDRQVQAALLSMCEDRQRHRPRDDAVFTAPTDETGSRYALGTADAVSIFRRGVAAARRSCCPLTRGRAVRRAAGNGAHLPGGASRHAAACRSAAKRRSCLRMAAAQRP